MQESFWEVKFYLFFICFLYFSFPLRGNIVQGSRNTKLTNDELKLIFGDQNAIPEYSLFSPKIDKKNFSRSKRGISDSSVFEFNALGQSYRFQINLVVDLISPYFVLIGRDGNQSKVLDWKDHSQCAYQGVEEYDSSKSIALVMCGNLWGVVKVPEGELVIEPLPEVISGQRRFRRSIHRLAEHIIYRRKEQMACPLQNERNRNPPVRDYLFTRYSHTIIKYQPSNQRNKVLFSHTLPEFPSDHTSIDEDVENIRPSGTFYIETAVFVDRDLLRLMEINFPSDTEEQVIEVVLAMVNAVQLLYHDPTLGHKVKYVLKRLELLYHDPPDLSRPHDIDVFLTKFCLWQNLQNPSSDEDSMHWDHALILTGLDLYTIMDDGKLNSQVVGLAPVAGMCTSTSSCTVNEGRHFESVYVVAHEIGHNLGMRHDGLQSGNNCDPSGYLMSPTLGSGKVTWSHCSKRYLNNFLRLTQSKCLRDKPLPPPLSFDHEGSLLPGQRFSSDQQCMLKNGVGSRASFQQSPHEVCGDLHCIKDGYTWTSHPALEGTTCGKYEWCRRGECVEVPRNMHPYIRNHLPSSLAPTFSSVKENEESSTWSECKSSCLYGLDGILSSGSTGLSMSKRQCSSCRDEYQYKVCSGVRQCSLKEKKTLQDYADEICRRLRREEISLSGYAVRVPVEGLRRCEVGCLRHNGNPVITRASYPDGTVCQSRTDYPTYCVGGFCTEFRCEENVLYKAGPAVCRSSSFAPREPFQFSVLPPTQRTPSFSSSKTTFSFENQDAPQSSLEAIWGPWLPSSDCRFSCITPSKGIQLVSRSCLHHRGCDGLNRNIQLCTPKRMNCDEIQTPFKYASEVCQRYSKRVEQLSGIGMQLSSTSDDPNRSCTVACQDASLKYRFYRVNGKDGWFPFGTECSKDGFTAFCLNGKCLEFNSDGTPLRTHKDHSGVRSKSYRSISFFEDDFARDLADLSPLKHIGDDVVESQWRMKRDLRTTSHRLPGSFEDSFLLSLVDEINSTFSVPSVNGHEEKSSFVDLDNPLFNDEYVAPTMETKSTRREEPDQVLPKSGAKKNHDGKHYKWKITNSPCSVTCGEGTMKQILHCVGEDEQYVEAYYCPSSAPQLEDVACSRISCSYIPQLELKPSSQFGRWLMGVVDNVKTNYS